MTESMYLFCNCFVRLFVFSDTRPPKSDTSSKTEDEFYVVDSPVYPGYNGYFDDQYGRRVYDNRRVIKGIRSTDIGSTAP